MVAHSHGGNVALQAVHGPGRADVGRVPVVSLATPFLHATPRRTGGAVVRWERVVAAVVAVVLLMMTAAVVHGAHRHGNPLRTRARERFAAAVHSRTVGPDDLLTVRAAGDEASGLLVGAQVVAWAGSRLVLLTHPAMWSRVASAVILSATVAGLIGLTVVADTALLAIGALGLVAGLLSAAVLAVLTITALGYGTDGPIGSLHAVIMCEAAPPGAPQVLQMPPAADGGPHALAHSSPYSDDVVLGRVLSFIDGSVVRG